LQALKTLPAFAGNDPPANQKFIIAASTRAVRRRTMVLLIVNLQTVSTALFRKKCNSSRLKSKNA